jgi:hypothetical protein
LAALHNKLSKTGQSGEAGRDQPHAQGGIRHLAEAAQIAWNQGIDLYGFDNNRLLAGFEYADVHARRRCQIRRIRSFVFEKALCYYISLIPGAGQTDK